MKRKQVWMISALLFLCSGVPVHAQFGDILRSLGLGQQEGLSDDTVVSGLKEALEIGTGNAVSATGVVDGYFRNEAIKILMPDRLATVERGLRAVGYDSQVDEFILSMNRAAEDAAPFARDIFWDAIREMSFSDARSILGGGETAATEYFREATSDDLTAAFLPVVQRSMESVGVTRQYQELIGRFEAIPFMNAEALDIDQYVVGKALDGIFHVLGEEERKIRSNPAARVTDLLRTVFGQ